MSWRRDSASRILNATPTIISDGPDLAAAATRIAPYVERTEVRVLPIDVVEAVAKLECLQRT